MFNPTILLAQIETQIDRRLGIDPPTPLKLVK
jgi:hypothetical protein